MIDFVIESTDLLSSCTNCNFT